MAENNHQSEKSYMARSLLREIRLAANRNISWRLA